MTILPITTPLISNYPQHAFYLSIISNKEECLPWIYSNYSNVFLSAWKNDEVFVDFFVQTPDHHFNPCFQGSQKLHRNILCNSEMNILKFIMEQIDLGYYVWLHLNEFYIPDTQFYKNISNVHAFFVYGYDREKDIFNISGFLKDGKYSCSYISSEELYKGFYLCEPYEDYLNYIHLLKFNPEYPNGKIYAFDFELFIDSITVYLKSSNPMNQLRYFYNPDLYQDRTYGIEVYQKLKNCLELAAKKQKYVDYRIFYTLFEHKKFMNLKFKFIEESHYYKFKEKFKEQYSLLEKESLILLYLFIKLEITQKLEDFKKVIKKIDSIYIKEKELLSILLEDLKFYKNKTTKADQ